MSVVQRIEPVSLGVDYFVIVAICHSPTENNMLPILEIFARLGYELVVAKQATH